MGGGMMSRMNGMFNPENKFWMFMEKVMNAMVIGILWFICSLPLVTMGAATTAVFQFTLHQVVDEEGYIWRSFFRAFRQNFRQATILWLAQLAVGAFLAFDLYVCIQMRVPDSMRIFVFAVLGCIAVIWLLTALYMLPILSIFPVTIKQVVRDAFVMAMGNLVASLFILAIYAGFAVLIFMWPITAPVSVGLAIFVSSYLFHFIFSRYVKPVEEDGR